MNRAAHLVSLIRERKLRAPRDPAYKALHALADRAAPSVRTIFRRAVAETKKDTSAAKLEVALAHHARDAALSAVAWDATGARILQNRLGEKFTRLIVAAGTAAQRYQPAGLRLRLGARTDDESLVQPPDVKLAFDARNPLAVRAAITKSSDMITAISNETRNAIRGAIGRAIDEGRPPRVAAKDIRDMIGLNDRQQQSIDAMRAADASDSEIAKATRDALDYRSELIAQTETMRASNLGQEALWDMAADSGLIDNATTEREVVATPDERECPVCADLDGQTFGLDEPIETQFGTVDSPPIHPGCRCVMVLNAG